MNMTIPFDEDPDHAAVLAHTGSVMVTGGPGAAKSTLSVRKAQTWIAQGSDPRAITFLTYSNRTQAHIESIGLRLLPGQARPNVFNYHKLGRQIVQTFGHVVGLDVANGKRVRIVNTHAAQRLLKKSAGVAAEELNRGDDRAQTAGRWLELISEDDLAQLQIAISQTKANYVWPRQAMQDARTMRDIAQAMTYSAYQQLLKEDNGADFDDLIMLAVAILEQDAEACDYFHTQVQGGLLLDELQDNCLAQMMLVLMLVKGTNQVYAASDEWQAIYQFRHALGKGAHEWLADALPDVHRLTLRRNYRSSAAIVHFANALRNDAAHEQIAMRSPGLPVSLLRFGSEHDEARAVVAQIQAALAEGSVRPADCAVIARTNEQLTLIERVLIDERLPYRILGRGSFFERKEIKEVLAFINLSQDNGMTDSLSLQLVLNVPERGLTKTMLDKVKGDESEITLSLLLDLQRVQDHAGDEAHQAIVKLFDALNQLEQHKHLAPVDLIRFILDDGPIGYRQHLQRDRQQGEVRIQQVEHLVRFAQPFTNTKDFLAEIELLNGDDPFMSRQDDQIALLTMHAAKGLEFRAVFVVGLDEDEVRQQRHNPGEAQMRSELQLLNVAVTRATDMLGLTYVRQRKGHAVKPSRFLARLPRNAVVMSWPDWPMLTQPGGDLHGT